LYVTQEVVPVVMVVVSPLPLLTALVVLAHIEVCLML
jgi:hypothetical protein